MSNKRLIYEYNISSEELCKWGEDREDGARIFTLETLLEMCELNLDRLDDDDMVSLEQRPDTDYWTLRVHRPKEELANDA